MPGCAASFVLLLLQKKVWVQVSEGVRKSYFPDCLTDFLCWQRVWTRGKDNYLYVISLAAFSIILIIIIVNEVYAK